MTIVSSPPPVPADELPPRHSVGVEPVTLQLREHDRSLPATATLAVVERAEGCFATVCAHDARDLRGVSLEDMARSYANTYGATYVPAVTR